MEDDTKTLTQRIDGLETVVRQLLHYHTPAGRFAAEQAYLAYCKLHNPLYGSSFGRHLDDALTQVATTARDADAIRLRGTDIRNC